MKEVPAMMLHQQKQKQEILQWPESGQYIVDMMLDAP
jgi:hypothetical protein